MKATQLFLFLADGAGAHALPDVTEVVALAAAMLATFLAIWMYLRSSFRLLERIQRHDLHLWEALGQPRRVWVRGREGGFHTIQPIAPWLSWVLLGSATPITRQTAAELRHARRLLYTGALLFGFSILLIVAL